LKIPIYQVDAFTDKLFSGNPAAVCVLEDWLPNEVMQSIALENNLSETAFVKNENNGYNIRWFTPEAEVNLCGHATLATARILFDDYLDEGITEVTFHSRSGELKASKNNQKIYLDFPIDVPKPIDNVDLVASVLGKEPIEYYRGKDDYLAVFDSEEDIKSMEPDFERLKQLDSRGLIISAPGRVVDFVSRCFFPEIGLNEDPVTGSAHTLMIPYWAKRMNKNRLQAHQISSRGGFLDCELKDSRVLIGGFSTRYLQGFIAISND
jgi:PhzF family phenazine biosynthesis protein